MDIGRRHDCCTERSHDRQLSQVLEAHRNSPNDCESRAACPHLFCNTQANNNWIGPIVNQSNLACDLYLHRVAMESSRFGDPRVK
jgi:hypothetical protein